MIPLPGLIFGKLEGRAGLAGAKVPKISPSAGLAPGANSSKTSCVHDEWTHNLIVCTVSSVIVIQLAAPP